MRYLRYKGNKVRQIMNITDIDDSVLVVARTGETRDVRSPDRAEGAGMRRSDRSGRADLIPRGAVRACRAAALRRGAVAVPADIRNRRFPPCSWTGTSLCRSSERPGRGSARRGQRRAGSGCSIPPGCSEPAQFGKLPEAPHRMNCTSPCPGVSHRPWRVQTLGVHDHQRHFAHDRQTDALAVQADARPRGGRQHSPAGHGRADTHTNRGDFVLGLDGNAAHFRELTYHMQQQGGGRGDGIAGEEVAPGVQGAAGDRRRAVNEFADDRVPP